MMMRKEDIFDKGHHRDHYCHRQHNRARRHGEEDYDDIRHHDGDDNKDNNEKNR